MSSLEVSINQLPAVNQVKDGDFFIVQTPNVTSKLDFADFVIGLENTTFQSTIEDNTANIATLSAESGQTETKTSIVVSEASQLAGTLDPLVEYLIDGPINMGTTPINVPTGGIALRGVNGASALLFSSADNYTMVIDGTAGSITVAAMQISVTGTGSKVYDVTNNGGGFFVNEQVTYAGCTDIGTVDGYGAISLTQTQDFGCIQGWTFGGSISQISLDRYASFNLAGTGTTFRASQINPLLITRRFSFNGEADIGLGSTFCDFSPINVLNDGSMQSFGASYTGNGTYYSNISGGDVKARFHANNFDKDTATTFSNTYIGGQWSLSAQETLTPAATDTAEHIPFVSTVYKNLQWFSSITGNSFVYDSDQAVDVEIKGTVSLFATNGNVITLSLYKKIGGIDYLVEKMPSVTMSANGDSQNISVIAYDQLAGGEALELWVESSALNIITFSENSKLSITARAS